MNSILLLSNPLSESWPAWVLLSLMVGILLANQRQNGLLSGAFKGLFSSEIRHYNDAGSDIFQWLLIRYIKVGVPSLTLYVFFFVEGTFSVWKWMLIMGLWLVMDGLKWLIVRVLNYSFNMDKWLTSMTQYYLDLWMVLNTILLPVTIWIIYMPYPWLNGCLLAVVTAVFSMAFVTKMARVMLTDVASAMYIFMYFMTLELLPIGLLCQLVKWIA